VQEGTSFIQSQLAPTSNLWYVTRLSTLEDPVSSAGHNIRYAFKKNSSGGAQIDLEVELRQNFVSTASPGTSIASWSHTNIASSVTVTSTQLLSAAQADSITAYTSMFLVFKPAQV